MSAQTREEWLATVAAAMWPWFKHVGFTKMPPMKFSCGFTSKGARSKRIGECHPMGASASKVHEIFIHPMLSDPIEVAQVVCHEAVHAYAGLQHKHGGEFKRVAKALGLAGKMTATYAGPEFIERVKPLLENVGPYPHGTLGSGSDAKDPSSGPKQKTKMLKVVCSGCDYTLWTTRKWLDIAVPKCPAKFCSRFGKQMTAPETTPDAEDE